MILSFLISPAMNNILANQKCYVEVMNWMRNVGGSGMDLEYWIIYSLEHPIYLQIATNDHFGRNAFEWFWNVETLSQIENWSTMVDEGDDERTQTWTLIAISTRVAKTSREMMRNTLHVRTKYTCISTSTSADTIVTEKYENGFLLVSSYAYRLFYWPSVNLCLVGADHCIVLSRWKHVRLTKFISWSWHQRNLNSVYWRSSYGSQQCSLWNPICDQGITIEKKIIRFTFCPLLNVFLKQSTNLPIAIQFASLNWINGIFSRNIASTPCTGF